MNTLSLVCLSFGLLATFANSYSSMPIYLFPDEPLTLRLKPYQMDILLLPVTNLKPNMAYFIHESHKDPTSFAVAIKRKVKE